MTSLFQQRNDCSSRVCQRGFRYEPFVWVVPFFGEGGYDTTRSRDCSRWFVITGLCPLYRSVCFCRWSADAGMCVGSFCRKYVWYIGWFELCVMRGCIMQKCRCRIGSIGTFLEMPAISTKNLSWWGLDNVGTRFCAGLSDNRWSPSSRVLVLFSHPLSSAKIREILSMFIMLSFLQKLPLK